MSARPFDTGSWGISNIGVKRLSRANPSVLKKFDYAGGIRILETSGIQEWRRSWKKRQAPSPRPSNTGALLQDDPVPTTHGLGDCLARKREHAVKPIKSPSPHAAKPCGMISVSQSVLKRYPWPSSSAARSSCISPLKRPCTGRSQRRHRRRKTVVRRATDRE